jgi:hypothetical protein
MKERITRKNFIQNVSLVTLILSLSEISAENTTMLQDKKSFKNLDDVSDFLTKKRNLIMQIGTNGEWKIGKILSHCAQSIEYSLVGFPENKPKLFQWTVGSAAFMVFSLRGKMSHGLSDPIPGAEDIADDTKAEDGINRLLDAISQFHSTNPLNLKPHFAYGALDKVDYDSAHTYHINNHFEQVI